MRKRRGGERHEHGCGFAHTDLRTWPDAHDLFPDADTEMAGDNYKGADPADYFQYSLMDIKAEEGIKVANIAKVRQEVSQNNDLEDGFEESAESMEESETESEE